MPGAMPGFLCSKFFIAVKLIITAKPTPWLERPYLSF